MGSLRRGEERKGRGDLRPGRVNKGMLSAIETKGERAIWQKLAETIGNLPTLATETKGERVLAALSPQAGPRPRTHLPTTWMRQTVVHFDPQEVQIGAAVAELLGHTPGEPLESYTPDGDTWSM